MKKFLLAGLLALLPLVAAAQGTTYSPSLGGSSFTGGAITSALAAPAADNCSAVPYSFTGDTNTGLCTSAADTWNLYTAGSSRLSGNSTALTSTVPFYAPDGTAGAPSLTFTAQTTTGFYRAGSGITGTVGDILYGAAAGPGIYVGSNSAGLWMSSGYKVMWTAGNANAATDTQLGRDAAATLQMGVDVNGSAVAQTLKAHDGITGTDIAGANLTLAGGRGTGAGTPGNVVLATSTALGSGTTAQALTDRVTVSPTAVTSTVPILLPDGTIPAPAIGWGTGLPGLSRSSNVLSWGNSTNASTISVYSTYTDASNYIRTDIGRSAYFGAQQGIVVDGLGSGANPNFTLGSRGTGTFSIAMNGTSQLQLTATESLFVPNTAPGSLTTATMARDSTGALHRTLTSSFGWTNAQVVALGATTSGDITVATLPAKTQLLDAIVVITGQGVFAPGAYTVQCGDTGTFDNYILAADAKAAVNTVYGDAVGERGTSIDVEHYYLPSYTATTTVTCRFITVGGNLSAVTGSTGKVILTHRLLP